MKLLAIVVAGLLVACGDPSDRQAIHAAMDPLPVVATTAFRPAKSVSSLAMRIDRLASELSVTDMSRTREQIVAIHGMTAWKQARARSRDYKPLEPARLDEVSASFARSVMPLRQAAKALRDGRIADGVATLDATVTSLRTKALHDLRSDLVDELVFDRDEACKRAPCTGLPQLDASYQEIHALEMELSVTLSSGARSIQQDRDAATDEHTKVVLSRAIGEGPAFGEACGPEALCESANTCMPQTHTCEQRCFLGAESPCPTAAQTCGSVTGLEGTYCRR